MRESHRRLLTALLVALAILLVLARAALWIHHGPRVHSAPSQLSGSSFK